MLSPFHPEDHWFALTEDYGDGTREYRASFLSNDEDDEVSILYSVYESLHTWTFRRTIQTTDPAKFHRLGDREVIVRKQFDSETIEVIARDNDCLPPSEIT